METINVLMKGQSIGDKLIKISTECVDLSIYLR